MNTQGGSETGQLLYQNASDAGLVEVRLQHPYCSLSINAIEQSRVNLQRKDELALPVHQAMLSALLFGSAPDRVLLAGLGGGALARYLAHVMPQCEGDAVELNAEIAGLCRRFFDFPQMQWRLHITDVMQWRGAGYDWLLVDIAEDDVTPSWLTSTSGLRHFKQQLAPAGLLVMNLLVNDVNQLSAVLMTMRKLFQRRTLCLTAPGYKNIIVIAFNQATASFSLEQLQRRCSRLSEQYNIDFGRLLRQLLKDNPPDNGVIEMETAQTGSA